ncbi:hypothetical protein LLH00_13900 [bacterium]|nr:hypothetical protein [bacterium]
MLRLMRFKQSKPYLYGTLSLAVLILVADYFTGPFIQFPILFLAPVALVCWINRRLWGAFYSISLPLIRMGFEIVWSEQFSWKAGLVNLFIQVTVLLLFAYLVDRNSKQMNELAREVNVLTGILPICCFCKKIRVGQDDWVQLEKYIGEHSEAKFSHSFCPDCAREHYGEFMEGKT